MAAPSPTIEQEVELGGLNLSDYCRFNGYDGNTGSRCYTPIPSPGEVADKTAYCTKAHKARDARAARLSNGTWVCEKPIDLARACAWQYGGGPLEAREVDGGWTCVQ